MCMSIHASYWNTFSLFLSLLNGGVPLSRSRVVMVAIQPYALCSLLCFNWVRSYWNRIDRSMCLYIFFFLPFTHSLTWTVGHSIQGKGAGRRQPSSRTSRRTLNSNRIGQSGQVALVCYWWWWRCVSEWVSECVLCFSLFTLCCC